MRCRSAFYSRIGQAIAVPMPSLSCMILLDRANEGAHHAFIDEIAGRARGLSGRDRVHRGWFRVSSPKSGPESDKVNVNLSVDKGKMKSDVRKADQKVKQEIKELEGELKAHEAK